MNTPIKTIADLLGHKSISTTFIYTKVDLKHLRLVAYEWPEVFVMKTLQNGPFSSLINQYLQLRRSLGFILQGTEYTLNRFNLYLSQFFPDAKTLTKPMIVGYLQAIKHLHASTLYVRFMSLRQFCRFLFQLNPDTYVPEKD